MKIFKKRKWVVAAGLFLAVLIVIQVGRHFFRDQEWKTRNFIYTRVKKAIPEAVKRLEKTNGLIPFEMDGKFFDRQTIGIVILIHGLDEPGQVWMNLAPALYEKGFKVLLMTYPNDQPIQASSKFFFKQMSSYFKGGNKAVSIVAHSMGGLISRDMLTDPLFAYSQKVEQGKVPRIDNLIMVGTPNHGSELAQFRFFTEIRDQLHHLFNKDAHWLNGLLDGAGEAGIDLLPGSRFLTRLNSRPLPDNLNIQVIAGIVSPWSETQIPALIQRLEQSLPLETRPASLALEKALMSMSRTIGDGLVSVDSAKLKGVPLTTVGGTHLTMIRNISESSPRIPPAVPLILKMLTP